MPLLYQTRILRRHLRANPQVLFVFGDNVRREGARGQAAEMRGEPNAIGIATKWKPARTGASFFSDQHLPQLMPILRHDLERVHAALLRSKIVVWPADGIGTGLSELPARAPKIWAFLEETRRMFERL